MPELLTKYFGTLPYEEEAVFHFPSGLPSFEDQRRFLPIEPADSSPLIFLQSVTRPGLCFLAFPVGLVDPDYQLTLMPEDLMELGLRPEQASPIGRDTLILVLLSIRDGTPITANLMAPIVVNIETRRAVQAIRCDARYSHAHPCANLAGRSAC